MIGIGIDTGGTCTDAVIYDLDTKEILATGKTNTTKSNLEIGIGKALDQLPQDLLMQAESFALSTTLATNACVENKGSRAKLLFIGTNEGMIQQIQEILLQYGIDDLSQLIVLDAKPENMYSEPYDPDWEDLKRRSPELFSECDAIGIVQTYPDANGGRFELTALRILREELTIPLTIAYEISQETDILKVCASTLLNARLIPLITEFMKAVHNVMNERGLDVPLFIVRSDGTLMSEEMAKSHPVETLLCGPAASVIGGCELAGKEQAIVVDMGGTTTDLALVQKGEPVIAKGGILIGQYRTAIKGLDAQAVSLGGDTAVRFQDGELFLDSERIIPISLLASQYDHVLPEIQKLVRNKERHTRWIHEFFVLQRDIAGKKGYTETEYRMCDALREKPLITKAFIRAIDGDLYHLGTERLEREGVIIRSGLTPTDVMILQGDFNLLDGAAAAELVKYIALNIKETEEHIPGEIYRMVIKKMYKSVGAFLLRQQYPKDEGVFTEEAISHLLDDFYTQACQRIEGKASDQIIQMALTAPMPLIGIGAPIHVFLDKVAELLGTEAIIPEYAHVANALGAIAGRRVAKMDLSIVVKYSGGTRIGYSIVTEGEKRFIENEEAALDFARETLLSSIRKRAAFQGIGDDPKIELTYEDIRIGDPKKGLLLEIVIHAVATCM
ncbi:MAG: hypothetical protein IKF90_08690 [Parasporobacterium sp.]|nr:hypothetical protein [Parasporobacterium sp.]